MKQSKLEQTIQFIGLDYKKELIKLIVIDLVLIVGIVLLYIFTTSIVYTAFAVVGLLTVDYFFLSRYGQMKRDLIQERNEEFITIISYFETFITNNNNVYQAFNKLIDYSSNWMRERIQKFLDAMDVDKTVQPFVDFASEFSLDAIKNVMLSIYQMIDQGEDSKQLLEFTFLFHEISFNKNENLKHKKEKSLSSMTIFPLIGAGAISVILTFSIVSIIGDMMNVI